MYIDWEKRKRRSGGDCGSKLTLFECSILSHPFVSMHHLSQITVSHLPHDMYLFRCRFWLKGEQLASDPTHFGEASQAADLNPPSLLWCGRAARGRTEPNPSYLPLIVSAP